MMNKIRVFVDPYIITSKLVQSIDQSKQYVMIYERRIATFLYFSFTLSLVAYSNPINIYI